jgi:hypothetical protein
MTIRGRSGWRRRLQSSPRASRAGVLEAKAEDVQPMVGMQQAKG